VIYGQPALIDVAQTWSQKFGTRENFVALQCSMMNMKTAMVLAAVSVLACGCAETKNQAETFGVSAQDPWYMIDGWHYEQDGIGWFTDTED
jgi:hypothetical protein